MRRAQPPSRRAITTDATVRQTLSKTTDPAKRALALAALLAAACEPSLRVTPEQMDKIHRDCDDRIRKGYVVSQRPTDIGRIAPPKPEGTPVVIYGASWCEACDIAKGYMQRRGIPFVDFDIELDATAKAAMNATLVKAGLPLETSMPVIDVRGTITKGFMPCVVEAAWAEN